jgi:hypothetical protein
MVKSGSEKIVLGIVYLTLITCVILYLVGLSYNTKIFNLNVDENNQVVIKDMDVDKLNVMKIYLTFAWMITIPALLIGLGYYKKIMQAIENLVV